MIEEKEEKINKNCSANCKTLHQPTKYLGRWKSPILFKDYLKTININHFYGYFDPLQITRYAKCMDELLGYESDGETDGQSEESDTEGESEKEEEEEVNEPPSITCEWIEEDDNGNEVECKDLKIPNCFFCMKHNEDDKIFRQMIEYYIKDVLGLMDKAVIKQFSKQIPGWKVELQEDLNLSKYMITKIIKEKYSGGVKIEDILQYLYDLE